MNLFEPQKAPGVLILKGFLWLIWAFIYRKISITMDIYFFTCFIHHRPAMQHNLLHQF